MNEIPARFDVLGVGVSALDMPTAVASIEGWVDRRARHYVCVRDVHGVMQCWRDESLRQIHQRAGMVTPDGMPLVWTAHLAGFGHVRRVYGPDLMLEVCRRSCSTGWRHYFYGAAPETLELLQERLRVQFPGLCVAGSCSPPYRALSAQEDRAIVERINAARPDIVWVGLSTPKQERWMAEHRDALEAPVLLGVGAAFDFHAGVKPQAPRWMQRCGLEWSHRLLTEPRRLWRRYLTCIPMFAALMLWQYLRGSHSGR